MAGLSDGRLDWSATHHCEFTVSKFGIMGLTRRREPNPGMWHTRPVQQWPIFLQGIQVPVVMAHKFLGVILDQELRWKEHVNYALQKGTKWVTQYHRLARPS